MLDYIEFILQAWCPCVGPVGEEARRLAAAERRGEGGRAVGRKGGEDDEQEALQHNVKRLQGREVA